MAQTRDVILARIANFGFLLQQNPTPLLREELNRAITLHHNAFESSDINQFVPDLNASHAHLEGHWARLYSDMLTTASLLWDMNMFEHFLSSKLLEDYANEPFEVLGRELSLAECTAKQHARRPSTGNDTASDKEYRDHVVFPLEEFMLDREHVESKLRAVATRRGCPGSDIQPLIDACDWTRLAAVLTNDRDIILRLEERSACSKETSKKILTGINRVQNKHFTSLSSPSAFTLPSAEPSPLPRRGFVSSMYDAIASNFRGDTSSSKVDKSPDEHQSLLGRDSLAQNLPLSISAVNLKKLE